MSVVEQVLSLSGRDLAAIGINAGVVYAGIRWLSPILSKWFNNPDSKSAMGILVQLLSIALSLYFARILTAALVPRLIGQ
jgi:hypothetical protein